MLAFGGGVDLGRGRRTTRFSVWFAFLAVLGVLPRSFPGVLNSSATFLFSGQRGGARRGASIEDAHIWFSENISAMCSLSQSISLRAEKENSSISEWAMVLAESLSSATQAVDPTITRGAPRIAILEVGGDSVDATRLKNNGVARSREGGRGRGREKRNQDGNGIGRLRLVPSCLCKIDFEKGGALCR